MQQQDKGQYFINATGKKIPQLFIPLNYNVPGKVYSTSPPRHNKNHSLMQYVKELLLFVFTTKIKQMLSTVINSPKRTLQSVYSQQSLAILANSIDLHDALIKAHQYNIPLIQIVLLSAKGEAVIKQKILMNFNVSHLINQNFVLYGDWESRPEITLSLPEKIVEQSQIINEEGLYFRRGQIVYAFISTRQIQKAPANDLEQNLLKMRNFYYQLSDQSHSTPQNITPQPSSNFSPSSSMFGPNESSNLGQNFNDSDEGQMENQPFG